jgi:transmembrane sensor
MGKSISGTNFNDEGRRRARATEWWLKLRAAEPTERDVAEWLDWHGKDPRNAEAFETARSFAGRIQATEARALSGLIAEFAGPRNRARVDWRGWSMRLTPIGVIAAATVMGFRLMVRPEGRPARLQYSTPVAVNRDIALPDGSNVVLGAKSKLDASFTATARRIRLGNGEAYFKVKHDEHHPFYVRAGELTIRDVGTAFDVLKTGQRVTVTVAQGRVEVSEAGVKRQGTSVSNSVDIGAGQQVIYSPGAVGLRVASVDLAGALGWRQQRLEFVDAPLSSVIANINRYSTHPLRIGNPAVGQLCFTGTVDLKSLDRWLDALQAIFPVRVEHHASGDTIVTAIPQHSL